MESGIYSVSLVFDDEPAGEAVLVLSGKVVHGGGPGYLCKGYYDPKSDTLSCELGRIEKITRRSLGDEIVTLSD